MRIQDILLALRRRWYLSVATFVAAVAATLATVSLVGPTYQANGAVLLVPPGTSLEQRPGDTTSAGGNPYLELSGLGQARDIVIRSMSSKSTYLALCATSGDAQYETMRRDLCKQDPTVTYEISEDFESNAPVILVTAEAQSSQDAVIALKTVMDRVPVTLTELQQELNLRPRASITSTPIVTDTLPDVVHKDQIRAAVLVGGGVLALGILLTGLVDGAFAGRRRPVSETQDEDEIEDEVEDDQDAPAPQEAPAVVAAPARKPVRKAAKPAPTVPDWGAPTENDQLAGVGSDRSTPHWD